MDINNNKWFVVDKILERVQDLHKIFHKNLLNYQKSYSELAESEKIPLRVVTAEIEALKSFLYQEDLDEHLNNCLEKEYYCGAEGIKNAKKWLVESNLA